MRFGIVAALGLIAGVTAAVAQQATVPAAATPSMQVARAKQLLSEMEKARIAALEAMCPVGALRAQRQSSGGTIWTISREDSNDRGFVRKQWDSGVHFDLRSSRGALRSLELSVGYIAPGARVMPVDGTDKNEVLQKTFDVPGDGAIDIDRSLRVGPAFEITRVHLVSATFADGQVWHATSDSTCTVEPSGFFLVGGR